jgi:hypothetical protein
LTATRHTDRNTPHPDIRAILEAIAELALEHRGEGSPALGRALTGYSQDLAMRIIKFNREKDQPND